MARGKRVKCKAIKKFREEEVKPEPKQNETPKKLDEKSSNRVNTHFKSEEIQEICGVLNTDELAEQHCFLGAVVIGKFDVVKKLLKEGQCIDWLDENRETVLLHAVRHFRLEMVYFLVTRGADISLADGEGNNALLLAAQSASWDQDSFSGLWMSVRDHPKLRPDQTNKSGYSLLHYVTKRQWKTVLDLLLAVPVSLDCGTNKGVTPLIMAASRGDSSFVKALLEAGADFTVEDQQRCTALCYAVAFSLQKNATESNRALELILAAVNDEHSKLPLELYLQRRLELLLNPPKSKAEFSKTVSSVLVHVFMFFSRFIYSGIDLLLELSVFHRLREAVERHTDDTTYTAALLGVVLEVVRHCDCCCQGPASRLDVVEAFFTAGLGKTCLDLLQRYGTGKTGMIKAVFLPLVYSCTSENYQARVWLQTHHEILQPFYNKYMRSFPAMFMETNGDVHLETEKQCLLSFQKMMKTLKSQGHIVTKEEHAKAAQKHKENMTLAHSVYTILKPNNPNTLKTLNEPATGIKRKSAKPSAVYNSIIQYNFGKLDIVETKKEAFTKKHPVSLLKKEKVQSNKSSTKGSPHEKKSRIAIKEIQQIQKNKLISDNNADTSSHKKNDSDKIQTEKIQSPVIIEKEVKPLVNNIESNKKCSSKEEVRERFSDGYQLFQMDDESFTDAHSENDSTFNKNSCEWLDTYVPSEDDKVVSDVEVANTINNLEDIFNRIVSRYDSTWKKQFEEGYLEAEGDSDDLLKLMNVLPVLETYHMDKLTGNWKKFCKQVEEHARKNHVLYAAMVSDMQLFLLEFEAELDKNNVKIFNDNSSLDSCLDTENVIRHKNCEDLNILSDGKPVEHLINPQILVNKKQTETIDDKQGDINDVNVGEEKLMEASRMKVNEFLDSIYISESEDEENNFDGGIWDAKLCNNLKNEKPDLKINTANDNNHILATKEEVVDVPTKIEDNETLGQKILEVIKHASENATETEVGMCNIVPKIKNEKGNVTARPEDNTTLSDAFVEKLLLESDEKDYELQKLLIKENNNNTDSISSTSLSKPPPGFEHVNPLSTCFEQLASVLAYSGTKYQAHSLALVTLPACKTELLDGGSVRMAALEYQQDFKLFNGCNFGDVELGLSSSGMPLAVRRFQKFDTICNKTVSMTLCQLVQSMLQLEHKHVLPYLMCSDQVHAVVIAMPLCYQDLGQYIRQIRGTLGARPDDVASLSGHLVDLARQLMSGLHYLHTRDKPIVHGNLKPSNVLLDATGGLRLAEFGLHEVVFQQVSPSLTSLIWWSQECLVHYHNTWKLICSQRSDIQSAGMLVHFILTIGQHPHGQSLPDIIENNKKGIMQTRSHDAIATDLVSWMLTHEPDKRPTTFDVLRHILFWNAQRKWDFLLTCCGLGPKHETCPLPLDKVYNDLDILGQVQKINSKWIAVLRQNCEQKIGSKMFEDTPSGLLRFLQKNIENWTEVRQVFLELFPVLPLNLFRLLEQTVWIDHPELEPFTRVDYVS